MTEPARQTDPLPTPPDSVSARAAQTAIETSLVEQGALPAVLPLPVRSESIFRRRVRKLRRLKRGYYSFVVVVAAYVLSFFLPILANNVALIVRYDGDFYVPIFRFYPASTFGSRAFGSDMSGNNHKAPLFFPNFNFLINAFRSHNTARTFVKISRNYGDGNAANVHIRHFAIFGRELNSS